MEKEEIIKELEMEINILEGTQSLCVIKLSTAKAIIQLLKNTNNRPWRCPMCRALTTNIDYDGYCCQSCFDGVEVN